MSLIITFKHSCVVQRSVRRCYKKLAFPSSVVGVSSFSQCLPSLRNLNHITIRLLLILWWELLVCLAKSAKSIIWFQLDSCSCSPGLQAQSTSCKKDHTYSSDGGKAKSGRDSWEWTWFIIEYKKTQSEEESAARILPVCTSHAHTQTCRYPLNWNHD